MGDILSPGILLNVYVCGNEQILLRKTTKSMITDVLPQKAELMVYKISEYGFSFKSSDDKC